MLMDLQMPRDRSQAETERDLDALATLLKSKPGPKIRLIGYGDDIGSRSHKPQGSP
ncbi:MAG TPA: hypothetical protein VFZ16_20330 [Hyphomicrobiaceae bacterium]|nr:hypothetical protein [Hyphomicrobiaceae bacterium]